MNIKNIKKTFFFSILICLITVTSLSGQSVYTGSTTPGVLDVSPSGAVTYNIPITVIPGTQGIRPDLTIVYNSTQNDIGLLGMRFDLSGISSIGRVPRTLYHDNDITAVDLTSNDRFALDGNRLMLLSGNYGTSGSRYVTEMETFAEIAAYGSAGSGPQYFTVTDDAGNIMEYGATPDSRFTLNGTVYRWMISKITDPDNNYMTFSYATSGEDLWITEIRYGGNSTGSISSYAKIVFNYNAGTHYQSVFVAGHELKQTRIIKNILVQSNDNGTYTTVRSYHFDYTGTNPPLLTGITEKGEGDVAFKPTTITWDGFIAGSFARSTITNSPFDATHKQILGDFDGDGLSDVVQYKDNGYWQVMYRTETGFRAGTMKSQNNLAGCIAIDETRDGISELVAVYKNPMNIRAEITRFGATVETTLYKADEYTSAGIELKGLMSGDFDGDGGDEVLVWYTKSIPHIMVKGKNLDISKSMQVGDITLLDFNGNGKTNIFLVNNNNYSVYEYNKYGSDFFVIASGTISNLPEKRSVGDINGDGISDLIWKGSNGNYCIALGTGSGFKTPIEVPGLKHNSSSTRLEPVICDLNGDGKDDFVGFMETQGKVYIYPFISQGYANNQLNFTAMPAYELLSVVETSGSASFMMIGDMNKDSKADFIFFKNDAPAKILINSLINGDRKYVINKITEGTEYTRKLTYKLSFGFAFDYATLKKVPMARYLPNTVEISNGMGAQFNSFQYEYLDFCYSFRRKSFLGFFNFNVTAPHENRVTKSVFKLDQSREIMHPLSEYVFCGIIPEKTISREWKTKSIQTQNFLSYVEKEVASDLLTGTVVETVTKLNSICRPDSVMTYYYSTSGSANNAVVREKKKYTYINTLLRNNVSRYRPASVKTTSYMSGSSPSITHSTDYVYQNGRLYTLTESNQDGSITSTFNAYSNRGLPLSKTVSAAGCASRTETFEYDPTERFVTKHTNPLGDTTLSVYNSKDGNLLSSTDVNGLTTTYTYDAYGRLSSTTLPDGRIQSVSYYKYIATLIPNAKYYTVTKMAGSPDLWFYYDMFGREVCRTARYFNTETRYNLLGQITKISYPYQSPAEESSKIWTDYTYDAHGRKLTETGQYLSLSYGYLPGEVTVTDLLRNISTVKKYDAAGRTVSTTDPGGSVTYAYSYVSSGGKIHDKVILTKNGIVTTIMNDQWGNRLSLADPDAGTTTSVYNGFNELTAQTNANGYTVTYSYDLLGRSAGKSYMENGSMQSVTYLYDYYTPANRGKGMLSSVLFNSAPVQTYTYDSLSRLQQENKIIDGQTYTQAYSYDQNSKVSTISYPDNFAIKYAYDTHGDLSAINRSDNNTLIYKISTRNQFGRVSKSAFGNNLASVFMYDNYGIVTRIVTGNKIESGGPVDPGIPKELSATLEEYPEATEMVSTLADAGLPIELSYSVDSTIQNLRYYYDIKGLMTSRKDVVNNQCEGFAYDNLDRLTSHTARSCSEYVRPVYYQYDNSGNITSSPYLGPYLYGSQANKPHAVKSITLSRTNSNAITPSTCYVSYNAFNRPTSVEEDTKQLTLFYDTDQQRQKTVLKKGSVTLKTKYFVSGLYEKEVAAGNTRHLNYIYADNHLIAIFAKDNANPNGKMYYIHPDHLGSYNTISTDNKVVSERHHFDPWGNRKNPANWLAADTRTSFLFDRGFTGHEHLDSFKIINMNARLYDPVISRFFSPDPYVQLPEFIQAFNRYSYCLNNPLKYVDPSGELFTWYTDVKGSVLMQTNDGSNDIVVVPENKVGEFKEYAEMYKKTSGMRPYFDSSGWNDYWKSIFSLSKKQLSGEHIAILGMLNSDWSRKNAIEYWLNPSAASVMKFSGSEALSQWTNPELVVNGLSAGVLGARALRNVAKGGGEAFFEGAKYSGKVLRQMDKVDDILHGFPKSVDGYATKFGQWSIKIGADGKVYQWMEIPGSYGGKTGVFEYTKDANGVINHRFFRIP